MLYVDILCQKPITWLKRVTAPCVLGNKLLNIQFAKYYIWNNKSEGFPNMVLSSETFNQSVGTESSEAVNARYTFQPLWVSGYVNLLFIYFSYSVMSPISTVVKTKYIDTLIKYFIHSFMSLSFLDGRNVVVFVDVWR